MHANVQRIRDAINLTESMRSASPWLQCLEVVCLDNTGRVTQDFVTS